MPASGEAKQSLTVIVLTFNEAMHLERALESVKGLAAQICVVDSFSTDATSEIAKAYDTKFACNPFSNQAAQFQWALDHFAVDTDWVMRLDADEYLRPSLRAELETLLPCLPNDVTGIVLPREVVFQGRVLRHGGLRPGLLLRVWRTGAAHMEQRWMDEHIVLNHGHAITAKNYLVDENLHDLTWWTEKHNRYASREMLDFIDRKFGLGLAHHGFDDKGSWRANLKRRLKYNVYGKLPTGLRALFYFLYRYILLMGFLDGKSGTTFHFLQGFWYRFLVDAKIDEAELLIRAKGVSEFFAFVRASHGIDVHHDQTEKEISVSSK